MNQPKLLKLACLVGAAALVLLTSGCSGVNTGVGVSPASFLLPGLILKDPQPATPGDMNTVVVARSH